MSKLDRYFLRLIVIVAMLMLLVSCEASLCDEEIFITNSDGTTSVECVYYNNN